MSKKTFRDCHRRAAGHQSPPVRPGRWSKTSRIYSKPASSTEPERFTCWSNGVPIVLNAFTEEFVKNVTLSMADSLKGVGKIGTLKNLPEKEV